MSVKANNGQRDIGGVQHPPQQVSIMGSDEELCIGGFELRQHRTHQQCLWWVEKGVRLVDQQEEEGRSHNANEDSNEAFDAVPLVLH